MGIMKNILNLPTSIRTSRALIRAEDLQREEKYQEALSLLDSIPDFKKAISFSYHLCRAKILFYGFMEFKKAIESLHHAILIINSKKRMRSQNREYLLRWTKFLIARCYSELEEAETAEQWRVEYEKHCFDYDKVFSLYKSEYPITQVDYKYYKQMDLSQH